jgi:MFS transporter, DHA1 family, multidrug resistance protein
MIGFSSYGSFIPYYLQEIGVSSYDLALAWTAAFNSGAAIAMMIASPIWGNLADRFGRKVMLVRATAAGTVLAGLMSLVTSPMQLVIIRVLQGALCGTMGAAMTMVATETPENRLATSLGTLQTAQYIGMAIGPLIGGLLADATSYRTVFPLAALIMGLALLAIILLVHEHKTVRATSTARARLNLKGIKGIFNANAVLLIIALGSTSFAMSVLAPIMPFYIQSIVSDSSKLATIAGLVTSASAVTTAIAAIWIGRLGDRVGYKQVLVFCMIGVALIFVPQGFIRSPWQLIVLRAFQGVFIGGILPTANALLARSTRHENRGTIFGMATSAQSGGNALGPVIGAAVAGSLGLASGFFITAAIFGAIALLLILFIKRNIGYPTTIEVTPAVAALPKLRGLDE